MYRIVDLRVISRLTVISRLETGVGLKEFGEPRHGIVIFDSKFGNTEKVAKSLAGGLVRAGVETVCANMRDVKMESLLGFELIAVGGPTQMFTASKPMKDFLLNLEGVQGLKGRLGFAFDTKFGNALSGSAAKYVEKRLEAFGMKIIRPRQSGIVGKTEGPLEEGEMEAFEKIGYEIGNTVRKDEKTAPSLTARL